MEGPPAGKRSGELATRRVLKLKALPELDDDISPTISQVDPDPWAEVDAALGLRPFGNGSFFADGTPERRREVAQMFAPANRAFAELRQIQREKPWMKFSIFAMAVELPSRREKQQTNARPTIFDPAEVRKTLKILRGPSDVFEIRALNAQLKGERFTGTVFGYFDSHDKCIAELGRIQSAVGIYITLNPVKPALLARANNRLKYARKGDPATIDKDVERRQWFLIDVDPVRPAGISATAAEKEAAMSKANLIWAFLRERGLPEPVFADSGNGAHLLYRVDLPREDEKLLEQALYVLAERFDDDEVEIDRGVHNSSRVVRLHGTLAAKGDHLADRPHRLSKSSDAPESLEFVSLDLLRALVKELQPPPAQPKQTRTGTTNEKPSKEDIRSMLASIQGRPGYDAWLRIISAVGDALPASEAIGVLQERWPEENEGEYAEKLKHRLTDVHVGSLIHLAKQHGYEVKQSYEIRGQSMVDYSCEQIDESQNVLGNRWLERERGGLVTGPSGIGKSTAIYQMMGDWACGRVSFGIKPSLTEGLRIIAVQTEDSHNDLIEMSRCVDRLHLNDAQFELVRRNTHIETINDAVGEKFIEKLDSFLEQKPCDLLILNPLSDFIKGELTNEAEVKYFLRQMLNPLLIKHRCGVLCVQPTPKTNRDSTDKYSWFDWMYWGAGSAEFARWARGGIVIVPTADRDVYRFIAAKRFDKLGWIGHEHWYAHSLKDDVVLWIPASEEQMAGCKKAKDHKPEDLHAVFPSEKELLRDDVRLLGKERLQLGYHTTDGFLTILVSHDWIYRREYPRRGKKAEVRFLKNENPSKPLR
jgi:hypothetical protein